MRAAERRVELSKQQVRERWDSLRLHTRDALVSPAALGSFALLGGVIGWSSARRSSQSSTEKRNAARAREARSYSPASSVLRGVASGLLQTLAAVAVEEALKSGMTAGTGEAGTASKH